MIPINQDNTIRSNNTRSTDKPKSEATNTKERFKDIYDIRERPRKTSEELAEEFEENKLKEKKDRKAATGKFSSSIRNEEGEKPSSLFDLAKEPAKENEDSGYSEDETVSLLDQDTQVQAPVKKEKPENNFSSGFQLGKPIERPTPASRSSLFDLASSAKTETKAETAPIPHQKDEAINLVPLDMARQSLIANQAAQTPLEASIQMTQPPVSTQESSVARLQKMIDEIVEHIYQIEKKGETSTVITLNNDKGIFKDVSIKISEFDSAKGQLNITIDNLGAEAKRMIDLHENQLFKALKDQGFVVHQFIATTSIENPRFDEKTGDPRSQRDGSDPKGRGQQQKERGQKES